MKKFLKCQRDTLVVFVVSFLAITFLAVTVMAREMTPEEKLKKAAELSTKAFEMAAKAKDTGDAELDKEALELVNEASLLVSEVASEAQKTGNTDLAQEAMNMANKIGAAITQIITTATYIAWTSTDSSIIDAAKEILEKAEEVQDLNKTTIQIALASGAVPPAEAYEPPEAPGFTIPVEEEPPIQDAEPASPV